MKNSWKQYNLGDVLEKIVGGGTPSKAKKEYWNGSIPWATVKDMADGKYYISNTVDSISEEGLKNSASNLIHAGTVITSTRMGLGRVFTANFDVAINQDLKALIPNGDLLDNRYLLWLISSIGNKLESMGAGTTVKGIRLEQLRSVGIMLPPLEYQKKIASYLDDLENSIQNNNKRIQILEETAQCIYEKWFVHFKFPGHEKVKIVDSELGKIPEEWEVGTIQRIFKFDGGFSFKSKDYVKNGSYKVITIKNVDDGVFINETNSRVDELPNKLKDNQKLKEGDVLLSLTGNVGRVCMVYGDNNVLNQRVAKVTSKDNLHHYAYCFYRNPILKKRMENLSHGVAQQNLSTLKLSNEDVVIPKVELRREFNSIVAPILKLKLNLLKKNQRLSNMRDLLLPRLISGEVKI